MYSLDNISKEIYSSVIEERNSFFHKNLIIVGDNAVGKTTLLKTLLDSAQNGETNSFYFIDSLNRVVYGSSVKNQQSAFVFSDFAPAEILLARKEASVFSKEDIFPNSNQGSMVAYSELVANREYYEVVFNKFFDCKIEIGNKVRTDSIISGTDTLLVNDVPIDQLSSSQAARMRLIMEIEYASKSGCKMVIIDEFDDHFDADSLVKLINQFCTNYPSLRFLFTTHSFDIMVQLSDMDGIIYNNPETAPVDISVVDCDDISEIGQIKKIRAKYIAKKDEKERFLSDCIASCLKNGSLSEEQYLCLIEMNRNQLTMKNKILFDYVVGHSKDDNKF